MDDDDIPDFLRLTPEERRAAWTGVKLTKPRKTIDKPRREEDPTTRALRRQLEKEKRDKKAAALQRLRENYQSKSKRSKR
jgi:hypothetical protein